MGSSWARYVGSSLSDVQLNAGAGDSEGRVDRDTRLNCGTRLGKSIKLREGEGQLKICSRIISIGLDRPSAPCDRLLPTAEGVLRQALVSQRDISRRVAWAKTKDLANVSLGFFGATDKYLANPTAAPALARFRSSANACSHSAMPCTARLVNMLTSPSHICPSAWFGYGGLPIPTKPPVCNGMIAPRDSWMMPHPITR